MPNRKSISSPVGYRLPPDATRFKPGVSGNPRGRPKGSQSFARAVDRALQEKVIVTEAGRTRKVTVLELALKQLAREAVHRNHNAIKLLLSLADRFTVSTDTVRRLEDLLEEDREILALYAHDNDYVPKATSERSERSEGEDQEGPNGGEDDSK